MTDLLIELEVVHLLQDGALLRRPDLKDDPRPAAPAAPGDLSAWSCPDGIPGGPGADCGATGAEAAGSSVSYDDEESSEEDDDEAEELLLATGTGVCSASGSPSVVLLSSGGSRAGPLAVGVHVEDRASLGTSGGGGSPMCMC